MKLYKKIIFKLLKPLLYPLFISGKHDLFMNLYYILLRFRGVNFKGKPNYIGYNVKFDNPELINLGHNIVISDESILLTHDYSLTTVLKFKNKTPLNDIAITRGITIGDNCFIGKRAIIMPGCSIGDNCIIGAGSVLRGAIKEESVLVGNPAKIIMNINELSAKWAKKYQINE